MYVTRIETAIALEDYDMMCTIGTVHCLFAEQQRVISPPSGDRCPWPSMATPIHAIYLCLTTFLVRSLMPQ
jgi:hypothetical protein